MSQSANEVVSAQGHTLPPLAPPAAQGHTLPPLAPPAAQGYTLPPLAPPAAQGEDSFPPRSGGTEGGKHRAGHWLIALALLLLLSACNLTSDPVEITPEPTPDLPRVEILQPANNQQVIEGTEFTFDVVGRDENPGVARIEVRIDDVTLDEVPPAEDEFVPVLRAEVPWRASGIGLHVVEVIAYRPDGTPSDPAIINIEVVPRE